jgi:hypothetical protein
MNVSGFYEAIMARTMEKVTGLKHFDYYFGQYDMQQGEEDQPEELPFNCPAIFFEYDPLFVDSLGGGRIAGDCTFKLHVVSEVIQEMANREKPKIRERGHEHLKRIDESIVAIKTFNGSEIVEGFAGFGSISFIGMEPYKPLGKYLVHIISFKTRLNNDVAKKNYLKLPNTTATEVSVDNVSNP